jgi:hypothetical protein
MSPLCKAGMSLSCSNEQRVIGPVMSERELIRIEILAQVDEQNSRA